MCGPIKFHGEQTPLPLSVGRSKPGPSLSMGMRGDGLGPQQKFKIVDKYKC